ncbi:MAG: FtsQ-type POTRA domain-containing protein [Spirochaetes bacterium]|nr:FtsQ-type POTRA domain-containing protein [Spirochaetota bacterium]
MKFRHFYLVFTVAAVAFTLWVAGRYLVRLADSAGFFPVRQVQVFGLKKYPVGDLVRRSGLRPGESLVFLSASRIKRQVETVARLKVRSVERSFPETLILRVEESEGSAVVVAGAESAEIDPKGTVLGRGAEILDWDKPLLRLPGSPLDEAVTNARLLSFLAALEALPEGERDFPRVLSEAVFGDEVDLFPRSPKVRLSLGVKCDLAQLRRARYALVYAQAKDLKARRIDLRTDPVKYVL